MLIGIDTDEQLADPRQDLDLGGFGVVKVDPGAPLRWERKEAFGEVARRFDRVSGS